MTDNGKQTAITVHDLVFKSLSIDEEISQKQIAAAALIVAADRLSNEWIFKSKTVLSVENIKPFLATKSRISANSRALKYLYDRIGVNIKKFVHDTEYNGEVWGVIDDEYIYIIKSRFDKILEDNGYSSTAFLSWARDKKVIATEYGRNTMRKTINGAQVRCVWLRKDKFDIAVNQTEKKDGLPF